MRLRVYHRRTGKNQANAGIREFRQFQGEIEDAGDGDFGVRYMTERTICVKYIVRIM